jgi:molybdopterin biosynthesis enzyme MoaB
MPPTSCSPREAPDSVPRDITPEATRAVIEREAPGIAERLRVTSMERFPRAALSRGVAGVRNRSLVVNLPGSPGACRDALAALDPIVEHAVQIVRGTPTDSSDVCTSELLSSDLVCLNHAD